jgi:hypothetical protein
MTYELNLIIIAISLLVVSAFNKSKFANLFEDVSVAILIYVAIYTSFDYGYRILGIMTLGVIACYFLFNKFINKSKDKNNETN